MPRTQFPQLTKNIWLLIYSICLIISFVAREYIIDKIYSGKYGPEKKGFKLSIFITFLQSVVNCVYSIVVFLFFRRYCEPEIEIVPLNENDDSDEEPSGIKKKKVVPEPSLLDKIFHFSVPAIAQVIAMYLGNKSMEYVDNTTKTLAKSTKPISIIIVGILLQGKRYHYMRYIGIMMVTLGVTCFMVETNPKEEATNNLIIGILLSMGSLFMDGIVGTTQDWLQESYNPSAFMLMFSTNIWAVVVSFISLLIFNEAEMAINFLSKYPEVYWDLLIFTIACPIGNQFIFLIIQQFGSLQCSIITTVRKLITILFNSINLSNRNLSVIQWISVMVVFTGLGLDIIYKDTKPKEQTNIKKRRNKKK